MENDKGSAPAQGEELDRQADQREPESKWAAFEQEERAEFERKRAFVLPKPIPGFSIGAFMMPPIWGPAHGQWATIFFYPLWVFADSIFMSAYKNGGWVILGAVVIFIAMFVLTFLYAKTAQKPAYYRVREKYTPEQYAKRERVWAVAMTIIGIFVVAFATYYNLFLYDAVKGSIS
ncbi:MAG: viscotoxin-A3 [Actinobacteria bacterium]|nr:viscotoxin-A3 [Actinomycetota bacterium]